MNWWGNGSTEGIVFNFVLMAICLFMLGLRAWAEIDFQKKKKAKEKLEQEQKEERERMGITSQLRDRDLQPYPCKWREFNNGWRDLKLWRRLKEEGWDGVTYCYYGNGLDDFWVEWSKFQLTECPAKFGHSGRVKEDFGKTYVVPKSVSYDVENINEINDALVAHHERMTKEHPALYTRF